MAKLPLTEQPPRNIIVRMPNWLGDLIMATPVIRDIRAQWPDAKITAMCQSNMAPLLEADPNLNEVYAFHNVSGWLRRPENRDVIQKLKKGKYDLGVLTTNSFSSAWWFWRSGIQRRVGFEGQMRTWTLTDPVVVPARIEKMHLVDVYKRILRPIGIAPSKTSPRVYVSKQEKIQAEKRFASLGITEHHIIVGINPSSAYGPAKQWPADRFRAVAEKLIDDPLVRVVVFGDPAGIGVANEVCRNLPEQVVNLAGKTNLREFMAMLSLCKAFVTNDSGPMHLAAALHIPLVALFGSTNPTRTGPYEFGQVIYKHAKCSPCHKRECPIDFHCMTQIEVDEVYDAAYKLVQKSFEFPKR